MMEVGSSNCYCCPLSSLPQSLSLSQSLPIAVTSSLLAVTPQSKPAVEFSGNTSPAQMDLDSALNELGMLSSATESWQQHHGGEREMRRLALPPRERNLSEPSLAVVNPPPATPSNSPNKASYQILHLNTQYITSLSSRMFSGMQGATADFGCGSLSGCGALEPADLQDSVLGSSAREWLDFGRKYEENELMREARASRLSKIRSVRSKRFRRPYEVPWRHHVERIYNATSKAATLSNSSSIELKNSNASSSSLFSSPEKSSRLADSHLCSSNASTPEKSSVASSHFHNATGGSTVSRSRSLDELDFAKLRVAETESHNFLLERKEIDSVSQHLKALQVEDTL